MPASLSSSKVSRVSPVAGLIVAVAIETASLIPEKCVRPVHAKCDRPQSPSTDLIGNARSAQGAMSPLGIRLTPHHARLLPEPLEPDVARSPVARDEAGDVATLVALEIDVRDRKRAREAVAARPGERRRPEATVADHELPVLDGKVIVGLELGAEVAARVLREVRLRRLAHRLAGMIAVLVEDDPLDAAVVRRLE